MPEQALARIHHLSSRVAFPDLVRNVALAVPYLAQERPERAVSWAAVLFDRDGILAHNIPFNGDPDRVAPVPDAATAVVALRRAGIRMGVVTNRFDVERDLISAAQLAAVNARGDELIDIASDVAATRAAGARAVLVPAEATKPQERTGVPWASGPAEAAGAILAGRAGRVPSRTGKKPS